MTGILAGFILIIAETVGPRGWTATPDPKNPPAVEAPASVAPAPLAPFRIHIVDAQTSRGIPLVKLVLTNTAEYYTDSAGMIAFLEPELMNCDVGATIESYGYSYEPRDWFGAQTVRFVPTPGGSVTFSMQRHNIAERLYRSTGVGIYRDSILLGDRVPETADPSKYPVTGIDGSEVVLYKGRLLWIRGDTGISATGLGNFSSTGATSELPGKGGLDPEVGVKLTYFRKPNGWPKPMVNIESKSPLWCGCLRVAVDDDGREHLFGHYLRVGKDDEPSEEGLVEFNDATEQFDKVLAYDPDLVVQPLDGRPFRFREDGVEYFGLFLKYAPHVRCRADVASIKDPASYEALTCLKEGSRYNGQADQLDRDAEGRLRWGWKRNTSPIIQEQAALIASGAMKSEEARFRLTDVNNGVEIASHVGSVFWNPYRNRWVSIQLQEWGESWIGEVWYFEGDTPLGPWVYGQKVITHVMRDYKKEEGMRLDELMAKKDEKETMSYYCTRSLPLFDKDGGRIIFIEGSYSSSFASAKYPTPRYDYNEMMYKLDLSDPRLFLPVPIYRIGGEPGGFASKNDLPDDADIGEIAFFAPDRHREGTVPIYEHADRDHRAVILSAEKPADSARSAFYAPPGNGKGADAMLLRTTVPLNEFIQTETGARIYTTEASFDSPGFEKSSAAVCRVWPTPFLFNPLRTMGKRLEPVVEH